MWSPPGMSNVPDNESNYPHVAVHVLVPLFSYRAFLPWNNGSGYFFVFLFICLFPVFKTWLAVLVLVDGVLVFYLSIESCI